MAPDQGSQSSEPGWLVMLYLAGDNNLTEEMVLALQNLLPHESRSSDLIVAQLDPSGVGLSTQRYNFGELKGTKLEAYRDKKFSGESDTGSPATLRAFIEWAVAQAKDMGREDMRYLLILSGHGSGTTEDFLLSDENSRDALSIPALQEALQEVTAKIGKIDILGMDAC
jgi:Clostripain family